MAAASSLRGVRVLIVDDEPDSRELLAELLQEAGMLVDAAATVSEAFDALMANRPDVIISDIGMPYENGYAFLRNLRQVLPEDGGTIPALALTGFARPEDRERAFASGFNLHLAKPIDRDQVLEALHELTSAGKR
jgi:CheY-like chemotaxis protein